MLVSATPITRTGKMQMKSSTRQSFSSDFQLASGPLTGGDREVRLKRNGKETEERPENLTVGEVELGI